MKKVRWAQVEDQAKKKGGNNVSYHPPCHLNCGKDLLKQDKYSKIPSHDGGGGNGNSSNNNSSSGSSSSNRNCVLAFQHYGNNFVFISLQLNFHYILHTAILALCLKLLLASYWLPIDWINQSYLAGYKRTLWI